MSLWEFVYMCFVVTCWERADLLALVCGVCCEFVTFPLVSWVRCGTWLYRFLIFAPLLTLAERANFNLDLWNLFIAIVSLVLSYQVRIMTLALTVCKNINFSPKFPFICIRIIIWTNLVGPTSPMLHTKSQGHGPSGSEKKIFKGFYHIWAWQPSWSWDQNHLNKLLFPQPKESPYEILV